MIQLDPVSLTRRILDSAQSGLSKLTSLVIVDDEPLSHVESQALQVELVARRANRERLGRKPGDNPIAKLATSDGPAVAQRKRQAAERTQRVKRERDQREAAQRAAADEAFRRIKAQAAAGGGASVGGGTGSARSTTGGTGRPPRAGSQEAQVAEWYKTLDLQVGADLAEVKSAYRKLMRKYHPDMHASSPQKQKAATELSMRVTTAYNELTAYLEKK
jgi:DnaJ-domain-containing protein 1